MTATTDLGLCGRLPRHTWGFTVKVCGLPRLHAGPCDYCQVVKPTRPVSRGVYVIGALIGVAAGVLAGLVMAVLG